MIELFVFIDSRLDRTICVSEFETYCKYSLKKINHLSLKIHLILCVKSEYTEGKSSREAALSLVC